MLERYFKYPQVLRRLRSGALGEEMDRIAAHLFDVGYKHASAKIYISRLGRFSKYVTRNGRTALTRSSAGIVRLTGSGQLQQPGRR
jgi:integrase/recombinase XerD